MSSLPPSPQSIQLFSELLLLDQFMRNRLSKHLPDGVELSQFLVLLHLATIGEEIGPARLASAFNVTRGAMSNTLGRLERNGQINVRGDTIDARRKFVTISQKGQETLDQVVMSLQPNFDDALKQHLRSDVANCLSLLGDLRHAMVRLA